MDQTTLGLSEVVPCSELGSVTVHYSRREDPHADYSFPVLCKPERGPVLIGWVHPAVNGLHHVKLRCPGTPSVVVRLRWIAAVDFVEVH